MKKTFQSITIAFFVLLLMTSFTSKKHALAEPESAALYSNLIEKALQSNNPRGTVTRKGVKYKWELFRPTSKGRFQIKIMKESRGKSNLVLSTAIFVLDKGAAGVVVKFFNSSPSGYQWNMDKNTSLRITFNPNGTQTFDARGRMSEFERNDLGFTQAQFEAKGKPNPKYRNTTVRYVSATMRYLIFKYPKIVKG